MKIFYEGLEILKGFDLYLEPKSLTELSKRDDLDVYIADGNIIIEERRQHGN